MYDEKPMHNCSRYRIMQLSLNIVKGKLIIMITHVYSIVRGFISIASCFISTSHALIIQAKRLFV